MTEILEAPQAATERTKAVRRFDTTIEAGDGRTISFRIAPFGETAVSDDGLGGLPKGVPYTEELMPGLYDKQLRAANRIYLNFEHGRGLPNIVGHGVELERRPDGYHASFRIHDDPVGDKALLLVKEGVLRGASVESYWIKSVRTATGIVQRFKAHLDAVAICREGAYAGAVVTGLRTDQIPDEEFTLDTSLLPVNLDPEVAARCRRLGITLPQRYEAHPDKNGHPDTVGTPEDGTRHPTEATTSEE